MEIIDKNIELARSKSQPLCQDTGTVIVYVDHPVDLTKVSLQKSMKKRSSMQQLKGYLRQNSVDTLTGKMTNEPSSGHPSIHFHEHKKNRYRFV